MSIVIIGSQLNDSTTEYTTANGYKTVWPIPMYVIISLHYIITTYVATTSPPFQLNVTW